jgi:glycosyltransferase involved in cell wall biosynthesis
MQQPSQDKKILLSVVAPIYNEEENVLDFVQKVQAALRGENYPWQLICVDDGSRDRSAEILAELADNHDWLSVVYLRKNYGQSTAMQAGIDASEGEYIVTIDADLQNDPSDIPTLVKKIQLDPDIDVISGWRRQRQDRTLSRKIPSKIANALISKVTGVRLHDYGCSLKLYRKSAIEHVKIYGELHRFIPALAHEFGAKVIEMEVQHFPRTRGTSKYGIDRTIRVILDLIWVKFLLKYQHRPIHAFGGIGLMMLTPGMLILLYLAGIKLLAGAEIGGRPLLALGSLLTLMGASFIGMGILGEFLTRIWHEPAGKSHYLVKDKPSNRQSS